MKILVIHDGPLSHSIAITSLIEGIERHYGKHPIVLVTNTRALVFFKYLPNVTAVDINRFGFLQRPHAFDVCINYGGSKASCALSEEVDAKVYLGLKKVTSDACEFVGDELAIRTGNILYKNRPTKQNIFQVLYQMADLKWRGEGYNVRYYPRAKAKPNVLGVAINNDSVRQYLKSSLEVTERKLWHVPVKEDPLKQFDEVNKVESIITDDEMVMHVAVSLRKHVQFLSYEMPSIRPEFFGNGGIHIVPRALAGSLIVSS